MSKILENLSVAGGQVGNSVLGVFGNKEAAQQAAASVTEVAAKERGVLGTVGHYAGRGITKPFRMAFNGVVYVAGRPIVWADALGGKAIGAVGNFYARSPKTALAGTAVLAGLGVGHMMNRRSERDAQDQINELEMAQMRASQAQAQANTVTPAEYAAMEARMRQGGQNGGFAANVQAERAAAVAGATPPV